MTQTTCYFCDSTEQIERHHILPQRFDGSDKETNIVDLCHDCHWKLERLYNKEFWAAIGVEDPRATHESHISCDVHGCMKPSAAKVSTMGGVLAHRCKRHVEAPPSDKESVLLGYGADDEISDDPEELIGDYDWGKSPASLVTDLKFMLKNYLDDEAVVVGDLEEMADSDRLEDIEIVDKSSGFVTEFIAITEHNRVSAKYTNNSWEVKPTTR